LKNPLKLLILKYVEENAEKILKEYFILSINYE